MNDNEFDLFEIFPDGSAIWRLTVTGRDEALAVLQQLAARTGNEVRVMHLPTNSVIATMNAPADGKGTEPTPGPG